MNVNWEFFDTLKHLGEVLIYLPSNLRPFVLYNLHSCCIPWSSDSCNTPYLWTENINGSLWKDNEIYCTKPKMWVFARCPFSNQDAALKKGKKTTLAIPMAFPKQEKTNPICSSCSMQFEIISDCQLSVPMRTYNFWSFCF